MHATIAPTSAVRCPSEPSPPPPPAIDVAAHETADFLSWLRLSIYMCVVSLAIILCFQLKARPSPAEQLMAMPLGLVFWALSLRNYPPPRVLYSSRETEKPCSLSGSRAGQLPEDVRFCPLHSLGVGRLMRSATASRSTAGEWQSCSPAPECNPYAPSVFIAYTAANAIAGVCRRQHGHHRRLVHFCPPLLSCCSQLTRSRSVIFIATRAER